MRTRLVLDKAGRVVIPKPVREDLRLEPGDTLEMDTTGEHITLRPLRGTGPLAKEHGVWVFRVGSPIPASVTDDLLQRIREERDEANLGEKDGTTMTAGAGGGTGTEPASKGKGRRT